MSSGCRRAARLLALGLALVGTQLGCARCGRPRTEAPHPPLPAEDLVPRTADVVLGAPSVVRLGDTLRALERLQALGYGARLLLFQNAQELVGRLLERVGVDLRSPEAVAAAGLGSEGSVAVYAVGGDGHCLVAPLVDASRFERFTAELAARRFGAEHRTATEVAGAALLSYSVAADEEPSLGALRRGGNAALCLDGAAGEIQRIAALGPGETLSASEGYAAAAARQAATAEGLWLYLPSLAPFVSAAFAADLRLELVATSDLVALELDARWTGSEVGLAALTPLPALDLGALMPGEAVLTLRVTGDTRFLTLVLDRLWAAAAIELRSEGLDLDVDVFGQLEPGGSLAFSINRNPWVWDLTHADPRYNNPFKFFEPTLALPVRDGADAGAVLEQVASAAPRFGVQVAREGGRGGLVYRTSMLRGEGMSGALRGKLLLAGAPAKRLDELLVAAEREPVAMRLEAPAVEAQMDLARARVIARSYGDDAPGVRRWALRNTWHNWSGAIADLEAARLTLSAKGDVVSGRLELDVVRPKTQRGEAKKPR